VDAGTIALIAGTVIGGLGTLFLYFETRFGRRRTERKSAMDARLAAALVPIKEDLQSIHAKLDADSSHQDAATKIAIAEALLPVKDQLTTLNTKVEPLWKAIEALTVSNIQVLHKPHPQNAELDALYDAYFAYVDGHGTFTADQELRLRHYLRIIKDWLPGQNVGFHVDPGDPTSAAIVLATMDLTRIRRKQQEQEKK
jgi:hypothetical protein